MLLIWIVTKVLYILASALQIYSCSLFLGDEFLTYGYNVLKELMSADVETRSQMFPSTTLCDFRVRDIGDTKPYTVQCHLPINVFNSRIFLVVWIWLLVMAVINTVGFITGLTRFLPYKRYHFIKNILQSSGKYQGSEERERLADFVYFYLGIDGFIAIYYVLRNANAIAGIDIVTKLWLLYKSDDDKTTPYLSKAADSPNSVRFRMKDVEMATDKRAAEKS